MAVAFHNLELTQYSSQFLNDNVGAVPARYSQFSSNSSSSSSCFEDNPRCFTDSPVTIWDPYPAITSNSPSFFPVGTEETQMVYPPEEDLLVTDEFLRAIHASNSVGNVPQPVMINSDSSKIFEHRDQHVTSHIISNPEHQLHDDHYAPSLEGLLFGQLCADQVTDQVTPPANSMQAVESEGEGSPAAAVVVDLQSPPPSSSSQPQPQPLHRQVINLSLLRWQYLFRLRMSHVQVYRRNPCPYHQLLCIKLCHHEYQVALCLDG